MRNSKFGNDPIDKYTRPERVTKTKLTRIYKMAKRDEPEKPGRSLVVTWDARLPLIKGFESKYSYVVTFAGKDTFAGNHYHEDKQELFYLVIGKVVILLEDIKTKNREKLEISATDYQVIYIPTYIAHTVVAKSDEAILLVTANYPGVKSDEYFYKLK